MNGVAEGAGFILESFLGHAFEELDCLSCHWIELATMDNVVRVSSSERVRESFVYGGGGWRGRSVRQADRLRWVDNGSKSGRKTRRLNSGDAGTDVRPMHSAQGQPLNDEEVQVQVQYRH